MNRKVRILTALVTLTVGIALAVYAGGTLLSRPRTGLAVESNRVVNLGTILVTPEDASPPLGRDGARYALRTDRRAHAHDEIRSAI